MAAAKATAPDPRRAMIALSHELGRSDQRLAILAEGNTSARVSRRTFVVKASGFSLANLDRSGVTECRFDRLLALLDASSVSD